MDEPAARPGRDVAPPSGPVLADRAGPSGGMPARPSARRTPRRVAAALALVAAVVAVHLGVTREIAARMRVDAAPPMPPRMTVRYLREMALAAPPVVRPAPPPPRPKRRPARPAAPNAMAAASAASAPDTTVAAATPAPDDAPPLPADAPSAPAGPASAAGAVAAAAEPAASAAEDAVPAVADAASAPDAAGDTFAWPASTRVTYDLTGHYNGEVLGDAQVEWVKAGSRYQVHVDLSIGPRLAPLAQRRMSSEGKLRGVELLPARYDEETIALFRAPRRVTVLLGDDEIVLAGGARTERIAGVQDSASQFIQLAVLLALRPDLTQPGSRLEIVLALPRYLDVWQYDVVGTDTLQTSFGPIDAVHLKPWRPQRRPGELLAQIWFAPQLRYLPVRIRIEQDASTWVDLKVARRPELGVP